MRFVSATTRLTVGLLCLGGSVWMAAFALGLFPDRQHAVIAGRVALCENVALHCSLLASRNDRRTMETALDGLFQRNDEIASVAVRRSDGSLLVSMGPHLRQWDLPPGSQSTASQMRVPILAGGAEWGTVEVRFRDSLAQGLAPWLRHPLAALGIFISAATYLLYFAYLSKMLQHLDPSRVIPRRVRKTLDTLAEGLLVLDKNERILMANESFAESIGATASELTGRKASELPWEAADDQQKIESYPWQRAIREDSPQLEDLLTIRGKDQTRRVLKVNATPVYGEDGAQRGAMASFDDVTEIEKSREELRQMLKSLSESRDEIHRQNQELERLASRDPLTNCLNRRAFFTQLESHWSAASRHGHPLSCIMFDLDHFKSINDTHGHQTGDMVLAKTAELLRSGRRPSDLVCRYGGEEFCILLPHTDLEAATVVAEQLRQQVAAADYHELSVTSSIGVSAYSLNPADPQDMIDQADKCLYVAKREGRNCVIRYDRAKEQIAEFVRSGKKAPGREDEAPVDENRATIPFHAVSALLSALAFRDPATVDHSRRVADLCVATARRLMTASESYVLEIAALLHDIGKIGVPDSILLKPGALSDAEWKMMSLHERIGIELVQSTFANEKLAETILTYRAWYGDASHRPDLPSGDDIPLSARILAIADAYDSMTNRNAYRQPICREEAFAELRRCAERQFDPELVERLIEAVSGGGTDETTNGPGASKAAAHAFGVQIERLAEALDSQDLSGISALAKRLHLAAEKYGAVNIAEVASQLAETADGDTDVIQLVQLTNDLVDLCRLAQRSYLQNALRHDGELPNMESSCASAPGDGCVVMD